MGNKRAGDTELVRRCPVTPPPPSHSPFAPVWPQACCGRSLEKTAEGGSVLSEWPGRTCGHAFTSRAPVHTATACRHNLPPRHIELLHTVPLPTSLQSPASSSCPDPGPVPRLLSTSRFYPWVELPRHGCWGKWRNQALTEQLRFDERCRVYGTALSRDRKAEHLVALGAVKNGVSDPTL